MYTIAEELPSTLIVHINTPREAMMDVTSHHSWIGSTSHLDTCDTVAVNIVLFVVTLREIEALKLIGTHHELIWLHGAL